MAQPASTQSNIVAAIWRSFLGLPTWVKLWMLLILAPVNMASAAFASAPSGLLIAAMAHAGMMLDAVALIYSRGVSRLVSAGHVLTWTRWCCC